MQHSEYAALQKERFSNNPGSSLLEVLLLVQIPVFINHFVVIFFNIFLQNYNQSDLPLSVIFCEFAMIIIIHILLITILSEYLYFFYATVALITCIFSVYVAKNGNLTERIRTVLTHSDDAETKLPSISHYRAVVNSFSVTCILAADFTCFPKRSLKTSAYGYSLMDTGVGLFVIANSLATSYLVNPSKKQSTLVPTLHSSIKKSFPLLVLGVGRYVVTTLIDYHQQVSEYGAHWNFFVTLAVLFLFNELFFYFVNDTRKVCIAAVAILSVHELLQHAGLRDWVLRDLPRVSFITANREGIVSLLGYEVLYLSGVIIRTVLPKKQDSFVKTLKAVPVLFFGFIVFVTLTKFTEVELGLGLCRKVVNCSYIFWIISIVLISFSEIIIFEFVLRILMSGTKRNIELVPVLMRAVNYNGLIFFLIGNLFTGLINISMRTLLVNSVSGSVIIILYMFTCCMIVTYLYRKKFRFP